MEKPPSQGGHPPGSQLHGGWLHDELKDGEDPNLAAIFALYNHKRPEIFNEIDFSQFKARMEDYTTKNKERRDRSMMESAWMLNDRQLHPRQLKNHRGELVFDLHPAKLLLREDIKAGAHVGIVPSEFQGTRDEYEEFDRDIFRQRIYQEERYQKYWNWLDDKRTEKQRAHKEQQEKTKVKEAKKQEKKKAKEEEKKRKAGEKKIKKEADTKRKADENKKKAKEAKRMRVNK